MLPRYLVLDVDDTLTTAGRITPPALAALARAADAGIEVILDTGRSAGWGAALLAYLPGVSAVIVENGGAWLDRRLPRLDEHEVPVQQLHPAPPEGRARLFSLRRAVAQRLGLVLEPTADDPFRLTDHTVVRRLPAGPEGAAALAALRDAVAAESGGAAGLLASSVHIHFYLDGPEGPSRSKADGVLGLLRRRGVPDPARELGAWAVAVGDSGNDASFFWPGRFALPAAVRNIERYLPEIHPLRPRHVTAAAEGEGLAELVDDLLSGRLGV